MMLEPALQQLKCVNNEALLTLLSSTRAERVFCKVIPLSLTLSVCHSVTSSIPRSIIKIQQPLSTQRKTEADNQTHIIHSHNQTKHTHDIQNIKGSDIYRIAALHIAVVGNYIHMSKRTHRLQIALYFCIFVFSSVGPSNANGKEERKGAETR